VGGVEEYTHTFLTSALDGGEWSASFPGRSTFAEIVFDTNFLRGWAGLRAGLNAAEKKFYGLESNLDSLTIHSVDCRYAE
jgi:hypothetical protein